MRLKSQRNRMFIHGDLIKFHLLCLNVELKYLRRPNMLEDIEPRDDIVLSSGDTLIVLGVANKLNTLEKYLLTGK